VVTVLVTVAAETRLVNPTISSGPTVEAAFGRLKLAIQRLLDAEVVLDDEAAPLLALLDVARTSPDPLNSPMVADLLRDLVPLLERLGSSSPFTTLAPIGAHDSSTDSSLPIAQ
jgi:hypothetical protein